MVTVAIKSYESIYLSCGLLYYVVLKVVNKNVLLYGDKRCYEMLVITTRLQGVTIQRTTIYIFTSKTLYTLLSYIQKLHISGFC